MPLVDATKRPAGRKNLSFDVEGELLKRLDADAARFAMSRSDVVRQRLMQAYGLGAVTHFAEANRFSKKGRRAAAQH
jgi:hypothetical protein